MDHLIDDNDRLEPCPFCGAEAEIIKIDGEIDAIDTGALCVQCTECGASPAPTGCAANGTNNERTEK